MSTSLGLFSPLVVWWAVMWRTNTSCQKIKTYLGHWHGWQCSVMWHWWQLANFSTNHVILFLAVATPCDELRVGWNNFSKKLLQFVVNINHWHVNTSTPTLSGQWEQTTQRWLGQEENGTWRRHGKYHITRHKRHWTQTRSTSRCLFFCFNF